MKTYANYQRGFTLIEMIVALGLFAVVLTIVSGAIITLIAGNQRFHHTQTIMSNLSFVIDSMTREMRVGYNYYCASSGGLGAGIFSGNHETIAGNNKQDCQNGRGGANLHGVSFTEGGNSLTTLSGEDRILYYYDEAEETIFRRIGNRDAEQIVADNVRITDADFFVTGTETLLTPPSNQEQPTITIFIEAQSEADPSVVERMQTTVTQRTLDL
jgi:prepilin-type N-terminal cleavage/methylation domain-containing protein